MKANRKNHILCVSLALVMALSFAPVMTMPVFAEEISVDKQLEGIVDEENSIEIETINKKILFTVNEVSGTSASSVDSLFSEDSMARRGISPKLSNTTLSYEDGKLVFRSTLTYNNEIYDLESTGNLYMSEKTDNVAIFENLILGEMNDIDNIHFVQLRIDKDKSYIGIVLQMKDTKQLMQFQVPIDDSIFDELYKIHENQLNGSELEVKILELYSISFNLIDKDHLTTHYEAISPPISTNDIQLRDGTFNGWQALISGLRRDGLVRLGNYSNIDASMFKGGGWHHDSDFQNTPYHFTACSMVYGYREYLTTFGLIDITRQSYSYGEDTWIAGLQAKYIDGMVVIYDEATDSLYWINNTMGVSYNNFQVGASGLTNEAVFINRSVNRNYASYGNFVSAAIALFSLYEPMVSVFDFMAYPMNQPVNVTELFEDTYAKQYAKYNGKVIRGITASTENEILMSYGHLINVFGTIKLHPVLNTSWRVAYKFNCTATY